jgi:hypothetical protein
MWNKKNALLRSDRLFFSIQDLFQTIIQTTPFRLSRDLFDNSFYATRDILRIVWPRKTDLEFAKRHTMHARRFGSDRSLKNICKRRLSRVRYDEIFVTDFSDHRMAQIKLPADADTIQFRDSDDLFEIFFKQFSHSFPTFRRHF